MNPSDELANALLKKSLHEYNLGELQQLVQQYPYFGPAHLLLTKKLHQEKSSSFTAELENTSLYFQNRAWLNYLLSENGETGAIVEKRGSTSAVVQQDQPEVIVPVPVEEIRHEAVIEPPIEQADTTVEISPAEIEPVENNTTEVQSSSEVVEQKPVEPLETFKPQVDAETPGKELVFEPYHTVDYFASQGIKYKGEERPKDRFGMQLKSFTEWLKTMKRIPVADIMAKSDPGNEKKVEQMAEYSLAERQVLTEAMAEVWKKQGNKAKAEDIYNKLSLLDPSKSSYFAAKIEELKKTS